MVLSYPFKLYNEYKDFAKRSGSGYFFYGACICERAGFSLSFVT